MLVEDVIRASTRLSPVTQPLYRLAYLHPMNMKKAFSFVCLSLLSLSGCSDREFALNNTATGTAAGSALGAGVGAIVGNQNGNSGAGVAIGAGAGALGGALIGAQGDSQRQRADEQEERLRRQERELERQRREIQELKKGRQYESGQNDQSSSSTDSIHRDADDPSYQDNRSDRLQDEIEDDFRQDL